MWHRVLRACGSRVGAVSFVLGALAGTLNAPTVCAQSSVGVTWPGRNADAFRAADERLAPIQPTVWLGSLLEGRADPSGLIYMRNRFYDPKSGRFTQEDPIGLAGGISLYGFAAGDPVNFADPFGLCPPLDRNKADCSSEAQRLMAADRPIQSQMTNRGIVKASAMVASGGVFGRIMSRVVSSQLGDEVSTNIGDKIGRQMEKRGWTTGDIDGVIESPYTTRSATNKANGNRATAFFNKNGSYVVRDDKTGDVIQISNKNDPHWVPDQTIKNPYRP